MLLASPSSPSHPLASSTPTTAHYNYSIVSLATCVCACVVCVCVCVCVCDLRLWLAGVAYGARTRDGELVDVDVPIELTAHRAVEPSIININTFSVFKSQQLNTNGQVRLISHIARISKRNVQSPGNETLHDVATWSSSLYRKLTRKSERMKCPHTWI